jgi:Zn-dependent alcohol dehydrogenase
VKVFSSGICHSQLHQMHAPRETPILLGHEATGMVVKKGTDVGHVEEGDSVLMTWVPRDIKNANKLPSKVEIQVSAGMATSDIVFTWADHTICDEQYLVKVDSNIKKDVTSIIGCAVMTGAGAVIHTANVKKNDSVVIFGVGGVGLSAVVGAKIVGADPIIAVDLDTKKLEFSRRFGATHLINASEVEPIEAIHEITRRQIGHDFFGNHVSGADFAFDCIGIKKTMEQIVPSCRSGHFGAKDGGTAVLVGIPQTSVELNAKDIVLNEKHFVGSIGGSCTPDRDFPTFLEWYQNGDLDLDAMITERYLLQDINAATKALESGQIQGRAIIEFA